MNIEKTFKKFYETIHLDTTSDYDSAIKNITKKLNDSYYDLDENDDAEILHCVIVGSIGRGTAIKKTSDVDMLFILPQSVYDRFNAYAHNGQSALLQDVKDYVEERYPRTDVKGDGQAVVIEFNEFSIDLVPAFANTNGSFTYADSNDGGSWKNTDPISEQKESKSINDKSGNHFIQISNMMRCWKDSCGFVFGGLLIDTLVHDYLSSNSSVWDYGFDKSVEILSGVLEYMSNKNKDSIIYALGSYQTINDKGKGAYIEEAKVFFNKIEEAAQNLELETVFISMFGKRFEDSIIESKAKAIKENAYSQFNCRNTEEYIEDKFPVNIKYPLSINCRVTANGWRPILLRKLKWLPIKRSLEFYIDNTNVPKPYTVYWKVRNVGTKAYERDCIRGQITKGDEVKKESSNFDGKHYVECYLIKNNLCVARDRLIVPINSNYIDNENKLFI